MIKKIFWVNNFKGKAQGGLYWRAFGLSDFIRKVEKKKGRIVGIKIDDTNNIELIYEVEDGRACD